MTPETHSHPPNFDLHWYETLAESSPVGLFLTDSEGRCLQVNQRWCEITGIDANRVKGRCWLDAVHPDDIERIAALWSESVGSKRLFHAEFRTSSCQGLQNWAIVDILARPAFDGAVAGYVGALADITESKHSIDELQRDYQKIQTILAQMPVLLFAFDRQGCLCAWNKEAERISGYAASEVIGNPEAMKLLCPDAEYRSVMHDAYRQKGDDYRNWDWQLVAKDGSVKTISFSNISGQYPIQGWANWGIGVDVTLCRETEHKLRERVKELNCLYKLSQFSNQPQLNIEQLLHYAVELLPQSWQYPDTTVARIIYQDRIFKTETFTVTPWRLSSPLYVRGQAVGAVEVYYSIEHPPEAEGPFLLEERHLIDEIALQISRTLGHVLSWQDLALLDDLSAKTDELEKFAHSISHDLRTPLTAIGGYAQFMQKQVSQGSFDQARTCAERIADITMRMEKRVNELLKLAKLGKVIEPDAEVNFSEVVAETLVLMAKRLEDAGISIEVERNLPVVLGDRTRLLEVIENLIDNAIKYIGTPPGRIRIGTRQQGDEIILFVEDNGIGIDPRHAEDVFELFWRYDKAGYGDGTGLAIVRRIINAHGGRIWVESKGPGSGSCFCFTLGHVLKH